MSAIKQVITETRGNKFKKLTAIALFLFILVFFSAAKAEDNITLLDLMGIDMDDYIRLYEIAGDEITVSKRRDTINVPVEYADYTAIDISDVKYQLTANPATPTGFTYFSEFKGPITELTNILLVTEDGYIKKAAFHNDEIRISRDTYKITDSEQFERFISSDGFDYTDAGKISFIPYYVEKYDVPVTLTTGVKLEAAEPQTDMSLAGETLPEGWSYTTISTTAASYDELADNGMYPLANGEYIDNFSYKNNADIALGMPLYYYNNPNCNFYDYDGNITRTFTTTAKLLSSAVVDGTAYWHVGYGLLRNSYYPYYRIMYSGGDYSAFTPLYFDGAAITSIPQRLSSGVIVYLSFGNLASPVGVCRYSLAACWLEYGGEVYRVKIEQPKAYLGQAGEYKIFRSAQTSSELYFTADYVHFICASVPWTVVYSDTTALVRDNESGEEYIIVSGKRILKSDVDALFENVQNSPTVILNNTILAFEQNPIIDNDTTMLPVRYLFEEMGAVVDWNGEDSSVSIKLDDNTVKLALGESTAYINGTPTELDTPPALYSGRTLVPLRFISENLGYDVEWDDGVIYIRNGEYAERKTYDALYNRTAAYVNGKRVDAYIINGLTYVNVESIDSCGYSVDTCLYARITEITESEIRESMGSDFEESDKIVKAAVSRDVVYVNGERADAFNIGGNTYIMIDELTRFGDAFSYDAEANEVRIER